MSLVFSKQTELPIRIRGCMPSPSYYYENDVESIIISTDIDERHLIHIKPGIYRYNLKNNTIKLLSQYPPKYIFYPECHAQFLDKRNYKLYLIDLKTNKMVELREDISVNYPAIAIIPSTNLMHIYSYHTDEKYLLYDINSKIIQESNCFDK